MSKFKNYVTGLLFLACVGVIGWQLLMGGGLVAQAELPAESDVAAEAVPADGTATAQPEAAESPAANEESANTASDGEVTTEPSLQKTWKVTFGGIVWTIVFFLAALFIIRQLTHTLERMAEFSTRLRLTIKRLIPMIHILGWAVAAYIIATNAFALPIQTLIAISASAGIALGFASQDILKNIFGGIMIVLDRPFQVGDKVEIGSYYGEVLQIGLRSVRIVTPDDNLVSIPNGEVMGQSVSNANAGESNAQVVSEFYLPPDIELIQAKKIAYRAAAVSRYVFLNKPITVIVKNEVHQGRSLLKMRLKAYVLDIRYEALFASEMTETVIREFMRAGLINTEQLVQLNPAA